MMSRKTQLTLFSLFTILAMVLGACTAPTPETIVKTVEVIKEGTPVIVTQIVKETVQAPPAATPVPESNLKVLRLWGDTSDFPTIDPTYATQMTDIQNVSETFMGLVRQNETTGEVELGAAESYEISPDGKTYTFHIRQDIPWVRYDPNQGKVVKVQDCEGKDRMLTAEDFKYGLMRTLDPRTASEYSYPFTPATDPPTALVGAVEFNSGPVDDSTKLDELAAKVGIEVVDPYTIKYTFTAPGVYNLNILGLWPASAVPKWLIEGDDCTDARGDRWTETGFFQGYGPYVLKEWYHDYYMTLIKNPFWPGTDTVPVAKIDEIKQFFMDSTTAFADFEAGNLDQVGIPSADMDRVLADPAYKDMIKNSVTLGTEMYIFNTTLAPTDDVRVRQALSLAIDREGLVKDVVKSGVVAPYYLNPGITGAPKPADHPDLGMKFDPTKAKELLDEYLKEKNTTADKLQITLVFNTSVGNQNVAAAVQAMWQENLGIKVNLINQERKVFIAQRTDGTNNVIRASWVMDYPDANNFMMDVWGPVGGFADIGKWTSGDSYTKFMDLINKAGQETDTAKRVDLYTQAEKILTTDECVVASLYWYQSPYLSQTYVKYDESITGYSHWEKWDIVKE
jgi:oligopeptide transport system substrate-binding protein